MYLTLDQVYYILLNLEFYFLGEGVRGWFFRNDHFSHIFW